MPVPPLGSKESEALPAPDRATDFKLQVDTPLPTGSGPADVAAPFPVGALVTAVPALLFFPAIGALSPPSAPLLLVFDLLPVSVLDILSGGTEEKADGVKTDVDVAGIICDDGFKIALGSDKI